MMSNLDLLKTSAYYHEIRFQLINEPETKRIINELPHYLVEKLVNVFDSGEELITAMHVLYRMEENWYSYKVDKINLTELKAAIKNVVGNRRR